MTTTKNYTPIAAQRQMAIDIAAYAKTVSKMGETGKQEAEAIYSALHYALDKQHVARGVGRAQYLTDPNS